MRSRSRGSWTAENQHVTQVVVWLCCAVNSERSVHGKLFFPETRVQTGDAWDFNMVGSIVGAQCWHTAAAGPLLSPCRSSVLVMGRMERLPTAPRVWSWVCSSETETFLVQFCCDSNLEWLYHLLCGSKNILAFCFTDSVFFGG